MIKENMPEVPKDKQIEPTGGLRDIEAQLSALEKKKADAEAIKRAEEEQTHQELIKDIADTIEGNEKLYAEVSKEFWSRGGVWPEEIKLRHKVESLGREIEHGEAAISSFEKRIQELEKNDIDVSDVKTQVEAVKSSIAEKKLEYERGTKELGELAQRRAEFVAAQERASSSKESAMRFALDSFLNAREAIGKGERLNDGEKEKLSKEVEEKLQRRVWEREQEKWKSKDKTQAQESERVLSEIEAEFVQLEDQITKSLEELSKKIEDPQLLAFVQEKKATIEKNLEGGPLKHLLTLRSKKDRREAAEEALNQLKEKREELYRELSDIVMTVLKFLNEKERYSSERSLTQVQTVPFSKDPEIRQRFTTIKLKKETLLGKIKNLWSEVRGKKEKELVDEIYQKILTYPEQEQVERRMRML